MASLCAGDLILAIEGAPATDMLHCEAQNMIKEASAQLCLTVERSGTHTLTHSLTCSLTHSLTHSLIHL